MNVFLNGAIHIVAPNQERYKFKPAFEQGQSPQNTNRFAKNFRVPPNFPTDHRPIFDIELICRFIKPLLVRQVAARNGEPNAQVISSPNRFRATPHFQTVLIHKTSTLPSRTPISPAPRIQFSRPFKPSHPSFGRKNFVTTLNWLQPLKSVERIWQVNPTNVKSLHQVRWRFPVISRSIKLKPVSGFPKRQQYDSTLSYRRPCS